MLRLCFLYFRVLTANAKESILLCSILGLLCGATLGGNLTPVGASANITAVGILRKNGEIVTFAEFMKIGVPFNADGSYSRLCIHMVHIRLENL